MLMGALAAASGTILGMAGLRLAHMAQELEASTATALNFVLAGDAAVFALVQAIAKAERDEDFEHAASPYQDPDALDGYDPQRRAEQPLPRFGRSSS